MSVNPYKARSIARKRDRALDSLYSERFRADQLAKKISSALIELRRGIEQTNNEDLRACVIAVLEELEKD